jgi:hypothetical protein
VATSRDTTVSTQGAADLIRKEFLTKVFRSFNDLSDRNGPCTSRTRRVRRHRRSAYRPTIDPEEFLPVERELDHEEEFALCGRRILGWRTHESLDPDR